MKIEACLFDLDGVLVDTAIYHYRAWKRLANDLGFDFTEVQNEQLKGISRTQSLELILGWGGIAGLDEAEKSGLAERKNTWYVEMISDMQPSEILPGAKAFLEGCRTLGLKCALGSASKNSAMILERTGLVAFFDALVDGNVVTVSKPDPEVFLKGAELLGVPASACVVFEDAEAGVRAGKAGGMKVVGIGSPLVLKDADRVIGSLDAMEPKELFDL